jgi:hypothetical protein
VGGREGGRAGGREGGRAGGREDGKGWNGKGMERERRGAEGKRGWEGELVEGMPGWMRDIRRTCVPFLAHPASFQLTPPLLC